MTETENRQVDQAQSQLDANQLKKAVRQHLQGLYRAGAATLPKGKGQFAFSLPESSNQPIEAIPQVKKPASISLAPDGLDTGHADAVAESRPIRTKVDKPVVATDQEVESIRQVPIAKPIQNSNAGSTPTLSSHLPIENRYGTSLGLQERKSALQVIQTEVQGCSRCQELASTRTQTVFGIGSPTPRLVFVGEGPGADEDKIGEPFVGAAGQLLDKIMSACKLTRSDVYILNTVKCRPPGNRNPSQVELDNCWDYAERQLEILQPEFICCLGSVAAKRLLNTIQPLGRLRQQFHRYRDSRVIVTYHPAYLLRTESAKKHVWADMKLLMKEMGVDLSK